MNSLSTARNPKAIVTRCGVPAYVNPPEPVRASVTMAEWIAGHGDDAPPAGELSLWPGVPIVAALAVVLIVLAVAVSGWVPV